MSEVRQQSEMTTAGAGGAADIAIIGGAGHVGLPLGLLLARNGLRVQIKRHQ